MHIIRTCCAILVIGFALAGCQTDREAMRTPATLTEGPPVQTVSGPYDAAKACIAKVPEIASIRVAVGQIKDTTGKINLAEGGHGTFITQGATDMFHSTLANVGVQLVEFSPEFRSTVDWLASKGVDGHLKQAQFMVAGSVSALDFLPGEVFELSIYGIGPKHRAYQANGRMDVRLTTLPFQNTAGGVVTASSSVKKQFVAVENEFGVGTFLGAGFGTTFASFRVGKGEREPMQYAIGFMVDYATVDLLAQLLEQLSAEGTITDRRQYLAQCRQLLESPYGVPPQQIRQTSVPVTPPVDAIRTEPQTNPSAVYDPYAARAEAYAASQRAAGN